MLEVSGSVVKEIEKGLCDWWEDEACSKLFVFIKENGSTGDIVDELVVL